MTLKKNIALLILALVIMALFVQVGAQDYQRDSVSDHLTREVFEIDGMPCVVVYTAPSSPLPDVSGVSCDWDLRNPPR